APMTYTTTKLITMAGIGESGTKHLPPEGRFANGNPLLRGITLSSGFPIFHRTATAVADYRRSSLCRVGNGRKARFHDRERERAHESEERAGGKRKRHVREVGLPEEIDAHAV